MVTGDTHSNVVFCFFFCFIYFIFMLALATLNVKQNWMKNSLYRVNFYLNDVEDWLIVFRCNDRINSHNYILFNFFKNHTAQTSLKLNLWVGVILKQPKIKLSSFCSSHFIYRFIFILTTTAQSVSNSKMSVSNNISMATHY